MVMAPNHPRRSPLSTFRTALLVLTLFVGSPISAFAQAGVYFPGPGPDWETRRPEQVGMDPAFLERAIEVATDPANEGRGRDLAYFQARRHHQPLYQVVGPMKTRGEPTGMVVKNGYIVAEWGEPERVDITQSVTKSFLTTVVGLAYDRGMIRSVNDPVQKYMSPVVLARPATSYQGNWSRIEHLRPLEPFNTEHAQPEDHVGSHASADKRLGGRHVGPARLGGSSGRWLGSPGGRGMDRAAPE
jgi:hypothetical protein